MSRRRNQIVAFLEHYYREHGYPPTIRDIGQAVGLSSTSTVKMHLQNAVEDGQLRWRPGRQPAYYPLLRGCGPGCTTRQYLVDHHPYILESMEQMNRIEAL